MDRTEMLIWIVVLTVIEINHFKWIWWTYWDCRRCGRKQYLSFGGLRRRLVAEGAACRDGRALPDWNT